MYQSYEDLKIYHYILIVFFSFCLFSCSSTDEFAVKEKKAKTVTREKDAFKGKSAGQFIDTEGGAGFSNRTQTTKPKKESDSFKTKQNHKIR